MSLELITAVAIGIGLAASTGFRVFVPMLVAAVAAKAGFLPLNESFQWLSSWTSIAIFGTATVFEIIAYYIPVVDNLLDTVATPLAVVAGTLLLTSVLPIDSGADEMDHRSCNWWRQCSCGSERQCTDKTDLDEADSGRWKPGGSHGGERGGDRHLDPVTGHTILHRRHFPAADSIHPYQGPQKAAQGSDNKKIRETDPHNHTANQ